MIPVGPWPADLLPPPYADGARPRLPHLLAELLPPAGAPRIRGRDVVVLLDGVGAELLSEHLSLTPTLRALRADIGAVRTVAPATTATALTSLTTGVAPLRHGTLGYTVIDPERGEAVQQLTGRPDLDPRDWMPLPTLAERSARRSVHVGPMKHAGSFLTRAAYAGWEFTGHRRSSERVDAVRLAVRRAGEDGLVFVHVDEVDHAGHRHGTGSDAWRDALAEADALLGALLRRLPTGTRVHVTADHGMVDVDEVIDLAGHPRISSELSVVAGESRLLMLRTRHDPEPVASAIREVAGERALVLPRPQLLASGLLGPADLDVAQRVAARLPDIAVIARGRSTVTDTVHRPPGPHPEVGAHGSLTSREALVPLLTIGT